MYQRDLKEGSEDERGRERTAGHTSCGGRTLLPPPPPPPWVVPPHLPLQVTQLQPLGLQGVQGVQLPLVALQLRPGLGNLRRQTLKGRGGREGDAEDGGQRSGDEGEGGHRRQGIGSNLLLELLSPPPSLSASPSSHRDVIVHQLQHLGLLLG